MSNKPAPVNINEILFILDNDFENQQSILDQIITDIVKTTKSTTAFVSYINNQLSNALTRKKGLILLQTFLPLCNNVILEEETISWINNSLKYCQGENVLNTNAFLVLKSLLEICYLSPDLNRSINSTILSKIIEKVTAINYNSVNSVKALACLETCLRIYSGSCISFKTNLEKFLLRFVDSLSPAAVRSAGRCLHYLQQLGGGGTNGINHKTAWKNQQLSLCATIHSIMDDLFESIMEMEHHQEDITLLILPPQSNGNKNKNNCLRIINLVSFFQQMLVVAFPVVKCVDPKTILNLIARGLAINRGILGEQVLNNALDLSASIVIIHKSLLQLLQALIICLEGNLISYSTTICKLIINNLKLTKSKDADNIKDLCDLRVTAYRTLILWIQITKNASLISSFSDKIIPILKNDITPQLTQVNLTIQQSNGNRLSKKAKKKQQCEQISQSNIAKNYAPVNKKRIISTNVFQNEICQEALNVLDTILINSGQFLKPLVHKDLQEFAIKTLISIQSGSSPVLYEDKACKLGLYKILFSLVINHHWNVSPPVGYALHLFSKGQTDENVEVVSFCSSAISNLNNFIHPNFPSLDFPLDIEQIKTDFENEKMEIANGNEKDIEISLEDELLVEDNCNEEENGAKNEEELNTSDDTTENKIINEDDEQVDKTSSADSVEIIEISEADKEMVDDSEKYVMSIQEPDTSSEKIETSVEKSSLFLNEDETILSDTEEMLKSFKNVINEDC